MTASQIQTIGNALASDLVARWGRLGVAAAPLGARPALVGETIVALVGKNQMIQQRNAEQVCRLAQALVRTRSSGLGVTSPEG